MENKKNMEECRYCKAEVETKLRRCPYCGILNPTVKLKEIFKTIAIILVVMGAYSFITMK